LTIPLSGISCRIKTTNPIVYIGAKRFKERTYLLFFVYDSKEIVLIEKQITYLNLTIDNGHFKYNVCKVISSLKRKYNFNCIPNMFYLMNLSLYHSAPSPDNAKRADLTLNPARIVDTRADA
jgi:hypothetical protein